MRLAVHSEAKAELAKSRRWYESRREGLGIQLLADVRSALDKIQARPKLGVHYLSGPFRFCRTKQFPFVIYYLELSDRIYVISIAHERRRPGYWKRRKPES